MKSTKIFSITVLLIFVLLVTGCASGKTAVPTTAPGASTSKTFGEAACCPQLHL